MHILHQDQNLDSRIQIRYSGPDLDHHQIAFIPVFSSTQGCAEDPSDEQYLACLATLPLPSYLWFLLGLLIFSNCVNHTNDYFKCALISVLTHLVFVVVR